ncbi:hypothetical protein [Chitinophaga sp. MM2321]|uniref:hypothetical protein n=1 Tax=Chitinophaga sp. MM2321 TaxID=3137178 RepID=UPI0032D593CD
MEKASVGEESAIVATYFAEHHKQHRVADLEQRLTKSGMQQPEAGEHAVAAYEAYFRKQLKNKGVRSLIFLVFAGIFLMKIINFSDRGGASSQSSFMMTSLMIALTAYVLLQGLFWGIQLFQLKEEISSFRDLRSI